MNEFEKDDQLYTNLVTILKLFKNRPYHLAKYLIENKAFDQKFINRIIESKILPFIQIIFKISIGLKRVIVIYINSFFVMKYLKKLIKKFYLSWNGWNNFA